MDRRGFLAAFPVAAAVVAVARPDVRLISDEWVVQGGRALRVERVESAFSDVLREVYPPGSFDAVFRSESPFRRQLQRSR